MPFASALAPFILQSKYKNIRRYTKALDAAMIVIQLFKEREVSFEGNKKKKKLTREWVSMRWLVTSKRRGKGKHAGKDALPFF